jgi:hypothetical protein
MTIPAPPCSTQLNEEEIEENDSFDDPMLMKFLLDVSYRTLATFGWELHLQGIAQR